MSLRLTTDRALFVQADVYFVIHFPSLFNNTLAYRFTINMIPQNLTYLQTCYEIYQYIFLRNNVSLDIRLQS
jgi:hypothetical protein